MYRDKKAKDTFSLSSLFPVFATIIVFFTGGASGFRGPSVWGSVIGSIIFLVLLLLRQNEIAAVLAIAVHIYVDWYMGLRVVALFMVVILLSVLFLTRSSQHPWVEPRTLWLWCLLLMLAIFPSIRGALTLYDVLFYFPNIFFGAFIIYWLGTIIARNTRSLRRLFSVLAGLATLLAIHTIIQAKTGAFLFASQSLTHLYEDPSYYYFELGGNDVYRLGSFFIDPNWNGTFFSMMLFIPLALFAESSSFLEKVLYLVEIILILLSLLFTYSAGAWVSGIMGLVVFMVLVGRSLYRLLIPLFMTVIGLIMTMCFPSQVNFLLLHATNPVELSLRNGAWETAIRVILAFPFTGVGLGIIGYAARVEPYRVPAQFVPLSHPHDSYLELGAMAGLPVLFTFVVLVLFALWLALRNWAGVDVHARSLFAGGIASIVVLSFNSVSINAWTLPPLAATGWLILGAISSPLLLKSLAGESTQNVKNVLHYLV